MTPLGAVVQCAVIKERDRQHDKWGEQNHPDGTGGVATRHAATVAQQRCARAAIEGNSTWRMILEEEVREAFAEKNEERLLEELIQIAAVAQQWSEAILRRSPSLAPKLL